MTVNADELELVLQRMLAELARARGAPAQKRRRVEHTVTIVATAVGLLAAMIPFVVTRRPPTHHTIAPPVLVPMPSESIVIAPAPTLPQRLEKQVPTHEHGSHDGYVSEF